MTPALHDSNELTHLGNGIWVLADRCEQPSINYSDGDAAEQSVRRTIAF